MAFDPQIFLPQIITKMAVPVLIMVSFLSLFHLGCFLEISFQYQQPMMLEAYFQIAFEIWEAVLYA